MRKPRDFDTELKALQAKAKQLKERKVRQLGELVIACGADAMPLEQLAGALIAATTSNDMIAKEEWRARGAEFFHRRTRTRRKDLGHPQGRGTQRGGDTAASGQDRAQ